MSPQRCTCTSSDARECFVIHVGLDDAEELDDGGECKCSCHLQNRQKPQENEEIPDYV